MDLLLLLTLYTFLVFDIASTDRDVLATFFFPSDEIRVDYDALLAVISSRDVARAKKFRDEVRRKQAQIFWVVLVMIPPFVK